MGEKQFLKKKNGAHSNDLANADLHLLATDFTILQKPSEVVTFQIKRLYVKKKSVWEILRNTYLCNV